MDYLEQARERFSEDIYATKTTGITIEAADVNYAKCRLETNGGHLNAAGFVMGGAIFTLADFTMAVAANTGNPLTVTLSSNISYMSASRGPVLYAEAVLIKDGHSVCFFDITVTDGNGDKIASVTASGFRKREQ